VAQRYLLLGVVCAWFTVAAAADAAASALSQRVSARGPRLAVRWLPLLAAAGLFVIAGPTRAVPDPWRGWQQAGPRYRALCASIDRDALVASENPWWLYLWCGNAGLRIPYDLDSLAWLNRYLDEQRPGFLYVPPRRRWELLERSPRLRRLAADSDGRLYEVLEAGASSRVWRAPPPLAARLDPPG
jgi:hypothetical protein